jgi:hypothetical protein
MAYAPGLVDIIPGAGGPKGICDSPSWMNNSLTSPQGFAQQKKSTQLIGASIGSACGGVSMAWLTANFLRLREPAKP